MAGAVTTLDGGASSVVSVGRTAAAGCPALTLLANLAVNLDDGAEGTTHGFRVTENETWTRQGSPHRLPFGVHVVAGASVTVAPCSVVLVGAGRGVVVQDDAALLAVGDAQQPIVFGPATRTPHPGDWLGVDVRARARPATRLAYVTVAYAGAQSAEAGAEPAAIRSALGSGLDVSHVRVIGARGWGVALTEHGGFAPGATELTVTNARGAGAVWFDDADQVRTLPTGSYVGNAADEVMIAAHSRDVTTTGTWRDPGGGVRYRVRRGAHVRVQGGDDPLLTIASGVRVMFEQDAELDVGWDAPGALVARGTDDTRRVMFTGTTDAPATWAGIFFGPHFDLERSVVQWALIAGAGAETSSGTAICQPLEAGLSERGMLVVQGIDAARRVTHTRFQAGPQDGYAVVRAGEFAVTPGDYTTEAVGNDFATAGTRCRQSMARVGGRCHATSRCD